MSRVTVHVSYGRQPNWEPDVWYQRKSLIDVQPQWERCATEPETCGTCGGETEPGYGLGAPCGGFSVYRFCLLCRHFSAVMPLGDEDE